MDMRPLGDSGIQVSAIALGCWPIAGMTSLDVNDDDSLATLRSCLDVGINFLDTAYCYGADGESERLIAKALGDHRDEMVIATKGGVHWAGDKQAQDASPARLRRECEESLRRLNTDRVELIYLHSPDPNVPLTESAGALGELMEQGKTRGVGVSNVSLAQLEEFAAVCPITAFQPPYNMLQRNIEEGGLPWCREHNVAVCVYWPLMKGLLAGKLARDHVLPPGDGRAKYPMFQGEEWEKNQNLLDRLREIAAAAGCTVPALVLNWTIHQSGVTVALCGAKRAWQNRENAAAADCELTDEHFREIDQALADRGQAVTRRAV